ncbi:MAG TPA: von Willebrand factor type A domain-containing protein [Cyclobacteriaceae bacterium]|nr:von Willebrand factor type A domain-containing protein [Cyclobacteriaceae bacterium]
MKTQLVILLWVISLLAFAPSQPLQIKGKVTDFHTGDALPGVNVVLKGSKTGTITDVHGNYQLSVNANTGTLVFSFVGYKTQEVKIGQNQIIDVKLLADHTQLSEVVVTAYGIDRHNARSKRERVPEAGQYYNYHHDYDPVQHNTNEFATIHENIFHEALRNPLSTFSIDVDAASFALVRRHLTWGQQPPKDAVRIEELVNYFTYDYAQPKDEHPFSITTEISDAPWNAKHKLVHIGLQGKNISTENLPPSNLVFLIDVSGSMNTPDRLPLVKSSFLMLTEQLRAQDRVAIVVYAGAAGLVLPSTPGNEKQTLKQAIEKLEAGGSTAGGAGLRLAYKVAKENFIKGGNNRVILATDGDFNVGESSNAAMERLIEEEKKSGVFLSVLGYGMGNYKDSKMETLANKGDGNYAYIDNLMEAKKVLVNEFGGTLFTIAKDVKIQVEFNPAKVQAYRLIGYENRMLKSEDFNNDKKDAGDLGSGHTVTALYEIIPTGVESEFFKIDPLKYQQTKIDPTAHKSKELMTVKLRYKQPDGEQSKLIVQPLIDHAVSLQKSSDNFRWSAAVAAFGMILRESEYVNAYSMDEVYELAAAAKGKDKEGYRQEFLGMIKSFNLLASR